MATVTAYIGLDTRAKMMGTPVGDPYVPAYRLEAVSDDPLTACNIAWDWSNNERYPGYRGAHAGSGSLYDGPSLSMGDVLRVVDGGGDESWFVCAAIGFEPCRIVYPLPIPDAEIAIDAPGRAQAGESWRRWLELMERLVTRRASEG